MAPRRGWFWAAACLALTACGERRPAASSGTPRFVDAADAGITSPRAVAVDAREDDILDAPARAQASSSPSALPSGSGVPVAPLESRDPERDLAELVALVEQVKRAPDLETVVKYLGDRGDSPDPAWIEIRTRSPRIVSARARVDGTALLVEVELFESIPGALVERALGSFEPAYVVGEFEDAVIVHRRTVPAPRRQTVLIAIEASRADLAAASVHRFSFTRLARPR